MSFMAGLIAPGIAGAAGGLSSGASSIDWSKLGLGALGIAGNLGSDLLGGALSYSTNKKLQKQSYKYARRLQQFQFDWQERMANTAHQREVEDLRAAGLNPILSATGGNGAAVPSGSGGTPVSAPGGNAFGGVGSKIDILSTILQLKRLESDIELNTAKAQELRSSAMLKGKQADSEHMRPEFELRRLENETSRNRAETQFLDARIRLTNRQELNAITEDSKNRSVIRMTDASWREAIHNNQHMSGTFTFRVGDSSVSVEDPSLKQLTLLSALQQASVKNDYTLAQKLHVENSVRKISAEINLINSNASYVDAEKKLLIHRTIQGYVDSASGLIRAASSLRKNPVPLDYSETTFKSRDGRKTYRDRKYFVK